MQKYEELLPYEFEQEKKRASIIYLASGPMEYHEECNALGIDPCKGYQWCLEAAEITGGIVFPMLPIAPAGVPPHFTRGEIRKYAEDHPPCKGDYLPLPGLYPGLFISREVCHALYKELLECFAQDLKFKLCVFVGSHGPAGDMCSQITEEMGGTVHGMKIMPVRSLQFNMDVVQEFYKEHHIERISHGGLWEAALNYAIKPEYLQTKFLDPEKYPQMYGALKEDFSDGLLRPVLSEFRKFTPGFAKKIHDATVRRLADAVMENYRGLEEG